jgi:tetratricopeptide (TPR) repeat protein
MSQRPFAAFASIALALVIPAGVSAQGSAMEEGIAHFEAGEFEAAQEALDRALWHTTLEVEQFQELLVQRAIVELARGDEQGAETDLLRLASLDPEYAFDRSTPPQVREAFEQAAGRVSRPMSLRLSHREEEGEVTIEASAVSDIAGLVTGVKVYARVGDGPFAEGEAMVSVEAEDGSTVDYYAEAIGPGGSVVAREGRSGAPLSFPVGGEDEEAEEDGGGNTALWVTLVVVGALAIAGGVVAAVLLTQSQETSVQPMIRF